MCGVCASELQMCLLLRVDGRDSAHWTTGQLDRRRKNTVVNHVFNVGISVSDTKSITNGSPSIHVMLKHNWIKLNVQRVREHIELF